MALEPGDLLTDAAEGVLTQLGERLRGHRQDLGRTLTSVAKQAQISVSYLSELESGASTPSLAVLARLAHALNLSVHELLRTTGSAPIATGALASEDSGPTRISSDALRLRVFSLVCDAGDHGEPPSPVAGSDLFVHVRSGELRLTVDGREYEVADGDSLEATRPGDVRWSVAGSGRCVSLWVTQRVDP